MRHTAVYLLVAGLLLEPALMDVAPAGAQAPPAVSAESDTGRAVSAETYRIGPEDMLQISVWKNEALTRAVPVRPDGMI